MILAVGFFDGVHRGHQAILKGADRALTFRNHPLSFLAPARAPRLIMTCEERVRAIEALGVRVTVLDFDAGLARLSCEQFLERLRAMSAGEPLAIRCGANWRFGRGGTGDAAWLRAHGVEVAVAPYATYREERISSTRIRRVLEAGEMEEARAMLGRAYLVSGRLVTGKGLGRTLGYPTLNVVPAAEALPLPLGAYAVRLSGRAAVANYGHAPTMGEKAWKTPVWEVHLLEEGRGGVLPNDRIDFAVLRFLRPERTFATVEALKDQIAADCREALKP